MCGRKWSWPTALAFACMDAEKCIQIWMRKPVSLTMVRLRPVRSRCWWLLPLASVPPLSFIVNILNMILCQTNLQLALDFWVPTFPKLECSSDMLRHVHCRHFRLGVLNSWVARCVVRPSYVFLTLCHPEWWKTVALFRKSRFVNVALAVGYPVAVNCSECRTSDQELERALVLNTWRGASHHRTYWNVNRRKAVLNSWLIYFFY
jgi:hypothetical protein